MTILVDWDVHVKTQTKQKRYLLNGYNKGDWSDPHKFNPLSRQHNILSHLTGSDSLSHMEAKSVFFPYSSEL